MTSYNHKFWLKNDSGVEEKTKQKAFDKEIKEIINHIDLGESLIDGKQYINNGYEIERENNE